MTRLILLFAAILVFPSTLLAQDPFEKPSPQLQTPSLPGQGGTLKGTVTSPDGAVIPGATVIIRNTNTRWEIETTTNASGEFSVRDLPPGSYDVIVSFAGFKQYGVSNIHLGSRETTSVNVQLGGSDVPVSSQAGGGGGGGGTKTLPAETDSDKPSGREPVSTETSPNKGPGRKPPSTNVSDVSEQSFTSDIELLKWLNERKSEKRRLATIVSIGDQTSLFVVQRWQGNVKGEYSVFLVNQQPDPVEMSVRINQYPTKTFIGIHRLSSTSYLMVFYGK